MGPECQCGCGEFLPEGSARKFKNGHKARFDARQRDNYDDDDGYTIEDAELVTVKDNEPVDDDDEPFVSEPKPQKRRPRVTKRLVKDIEGQLALGLTLTGTVWSTRDQPCGITLVQIAPDVAEKLAPVLCQSPKVVDFFTKSSGFNFMSYVELAAALAPLAQCMYGHHLAPKFAKPVNVDAQAPVYA